MPLKIISRKDWDSEPVPSHRNHAILPAKYIFFINTHSATCHTREDCQNTVQRMKTYQVQSKFFDLRYNFLFGDDGNVYEARGWRVAPMLPVKYIAYFRNALLLSVIGPYIETTLSDVIAQNLEEFVYFGVNNGYIAKDFEYRNLMIKSRAGKGTITDIGEGQL